MPLRDGALWDPEQYLRYGHARALPFHHLIAAIETATPDLVVDLGCGPGGLTAGLLTRWPKATIVGIDLSPEMIDHARRRALPERLDFELADLRSWTPPRPPSVVIANAVLHWLDDQSTALTRLAAHLAPGGTLAFQVPANQDEPSHHLVRELAGEPPWRGALTHLRWPEAWPLARYAAELENLGLAVTAWETTYLHRLEGSDPVLEWLRGTTLRPVLSTLDDDLGARFLVRLGHELRTIYPEGERGARLPFRRRFVVATRSPTAASQAKSMRSRS